MLSEIRRVEKHPPLISGRCGNDDLIVMEYIYEGAGEQLMPCNVVKCDRCHAAAGGSHTSAAEACLHWNDRMSR